MERSRVVVPVGNDRELSERRIGACLNVTPDHLDRHITLANYAAAKGQLFETQVAGDFAVLNYDDPVCRQYARKTPGEVYWSVPAACTARRRHGERSATLLRQPFLNRKQIKLRGLHNTENVMAASLIAILAGAEPDDLGPAIESFPGVEHRIEFVRLLSG